MREGILRGSRYSPGNMDRESLEALFVGREEVMEDVLSRVVASMEQPDKHYILLVGPRGSGKTHFLALAYHRIMDRIKAARLEDKTTVALLKEEEWGVASYLDLLVRILQALVEQTPGIGVEVPRIYDEFTRDPAKAENLAASLLRQHTQGKTLLLLCENLVDLFQGLDMEGQMRWRAFIQENGNWSIVATTPALFAALQLQDNPFFGFFTIRELKRIDFESGLALLTKKAIHEEKPELARFLGTPLGRARVRAIHHLAAGNHRAYVVLFDFLDKESLDDLVGPFMRLVDDITPYYQDRMRQIPPAQRKILEFLCLESKPKQVKEVSAACLMSQQTTAKQIGELDAAGFVSRKRSGRNTYCEVSEPLMRICIEVKDNKAGHFRLFVELLRHWFSNRELEQRVAALRHDEHHSRLDQVHVEQAVRCHLADGHQPFIEVLHAEAERCWDAGDYPGLAAVMTTLVREGGSDDDYRLWVFSLVQADNSPSAISAIEQAGERCLDDPSHLYFVAMAYATEGRPGDALSYVDRALALDPDSEDQAAHLCLQADLLHDLGRLDEAIEAAEAVLKIDPDHWHSFEQIVPALTALERHEDATARMAEFVQHAQGDFDGLIAASRLAENQGWLEDAINLVEAALAIDPETITAHQLRGNLLLELENYQAACEAFREVISRDPDSVPAHCRLTDALALAEDFEGSALTAERLIELDPDHTHAYFAKGRALIELGRTDEGIAVLDHLLSTDDCHSLVLAAGESRLVGEYASANRHLDRAAELRPDDPDLWIERTRLDTDSGDFDSALASAAKLEAITSGALPARLLTAQAQAGSTPLDMVFNDLETGLDLEEVHDQEAWSNAISTVLIVSVRQFGPKYLHQGTMKLQELFGNAMEHGFIGNVLVDFLTQSAADFEGTLEDWEKCLDQLARSLADLPECSIPIEMLNAAVRFAKTGNEDELLTLPLEQRQLLEETLFSS